MPKTKQIKKKEFKIDTTKVDGNSFICFECGEKYGNNPHPTHAYTVQIDNLCELCGKIANTTQVRDFRGLKII